MSDNPNRSIFDLFRSRTAEPQQSYDSYFTAGTTTTSAGQLVSAERALENPTVATCIKVISEGISQLGMKVYEQQGGQYVETESDIMAVMNRPNSLQTRYDFMMSIVGDILQYGNAYIIVRKSARGRLQALLPADPEKMEVRLNSAGRPVYNHKQYGELTEQQVIHVKDIAGHSAIGKSRVELARSIVGPLLASNDLVGSTFQNGISVNYSIETDATVDSETRSRALKELAGAFGGGGARRGGAVFLEGGAKLNSVKGMTPADADLRELRENLINEIAALFNVPQSMVGTGGNVTFNNYSAAQAGFYRNTLNPIITNIEQAMTKALLPDGQWLRFDVEQLVKGDIASQASVVVQLTSAGIITPNEARAYLGYNPVEGGDELSATTQPEPESGDDNGTERDEGNVGEQEARDYS